MLALLPEGLESALLPCSLILLIPGAAIALTARETAIPATAAFATGVLALSWTRFADRGAGFHPTVAAAALLIAAVLLLSTRFAGRDLTALGAGLLAGGASAELWRPCVGEEFGVLLNELPGRGLSGLGLHTVYLIGVLSPLVVLAAVHHLVPDSILKKLEPVWAVVGGLILIGLSLATALGLHEALVSRLFEWSLA